MEKKNRYFQWIFLLGIVVSFGVQFVYILLPQWTLTLLQKLILLSIQMISIGSYTHFRLINASLKERKKGFLKAHWIVFVIYCLNLIYVLFLDPDFGRQVFKETLSFEEYWKYNVNLDLFETIQLFIRGYQNHIVSLETLLRNILGNLIVFMPMAYFLPVLFSCQRKVYIFLPTLFMMVLSVEVLQVIFRIGSGDVDDLFLNVVGAFLMYLFLKCLPLEHIYALKERN